MAKVVIEQTDQERIEEIVREFDPATHAYTKHYADELPMEQWRMICETLPRETRGMIGMELLGQAMAEAAVEHGFADPEDGVEELVRGVRSEASSAVVGGGMWSCGLRHRDPDRVVDDAYDLVYGALAAFRGEPAPERLAKT